MNFNTFYDVNDNVVKKYKSYKKSLPNELSRKHKNKRTKDTTTSATISLIIHLALIVLHNLYNVTVGNV